MPETGPVGREAMSVDQAIQLAEAYQGQLEALEVQRRNLRAVEGECRNTRAALKELRASGKGDVMVPVGAGTFVHAELKDTDAVVTPIGAGVHVGMTVDKAREMLDQRAADASKTLESLESTMERLQAQLEDLVGQIQQVQAGAQAGAAAPPSNAPATDDEDE